MNKETGIIFVDVAQSVNESWKKHPPIKLVSVSIILLMVLTAFAMVDSSSLSSSSHKESPPLTGDKSFSNGTFSTSYGMVQNGTSSSWEITFGPPSTLHIYGHVHDNTTNQGNTSVVNQTVNAAIVNYNVTVCPASIVAEVGEIVMDGSELTVIVDEAVAVLPTLSVTLIVTV